MKNIYKFLIVALLMAFSFGVANVDAQSVKERFNGILVDHDADINGDLDVDGAVDMASTLAVGGDITLENGETLSNATDGFVTLGGGLIHNSTTITVTDGQSITPTIYSAYRLNAAGAVTITLTACSNDGQPLYLYGEDNQAIIIADSNIRTSDGAAGALGQYDVWAGMCLNSEWVEIANPANS